MLRLRTALLLLLVAATLLFVALVVFWPAVLPRLIYMPRQLPPEHRSPAVWQYAGEEVFFRSSDGARLHGWFLPSPASESQLCGTALFLHGNAGHLGSHAGFTRPLTRQGLDVLLFDYRGYGASSGTPSEAGLYLDAEAAYDYLHQVRGIPADEIVLVGHSLGSAVAVNLATRRPAAALVLAAPFASLPSALQAHLPFFPVGVLPWRSERYDARASISRVSLPSLMALGTKDRLVSVTDARALFAAAPEPKRWLDVPGGHNRVFHSNEFEQGLAELMGQTLSCGGGP